MSDDRLPTELWLKAHLRLCSSHGVPAMVVRRGDPDSGLVVLKINMLENGCRLLTQARDIDGRLGWMASADGAVLDEAEADRRAWRNAEFDPDIWIIEIEDRNGWHPFEGKVF